MKINPVDKQDFVKTNGTKSAKHVQDINFGRVLEETLQSTQASPRVIPGSKITGPILNGIHPPPDVRQEVYDRLDRILEIFEKYQLLLGDRHSSLNTIAGAVDRLKGEAQDLETTLPNLADGDPLKSILNETLVAVSKEIFQFESGAYVD